jgi:hypothetical protein
MVLASVVSAIYYLPWPTPASQAAGSFRGVPGGTFGALKAIIGNRWVLQDPRRRLLQCGWPTPVAIHQARAAPDLEILQVRGLRPRRIAMLILGGPRALLIS